MAVTGQRDSPKIHYTDSKHPDESVSFFLSDQCVYEVKSGEPESIRRIGPNQHDSH